MCGESAKEKAAFANETAISNILKSQFAQFAGTNTNILSELTSSLTPIQEAGPSQFGLAPAEEAALRTDTAEQLNAAGSQAANAVRGSLASRGGGTSFLPSGSEDAILGSLAQNTAVKEAEAQSGITKYGYDIGRQNWQFATEGLMRAPGELESPVISAGNSAMSASEAEMKDATALTNIDRAWEAPVGKLIGAGLSFIPGVGPALGAAVGGAAGTLPGGNSGGGQPYTTSPGDNSNDNIWPTSSGGH